MKRRFVCVYLLALLMALPVTTTGQEIGPENGSLVIVGGGRLDSEILERFLALAGGADAPIVVIPTAGGGEHYDQYYRGLGGFKAAGATNLTVLHTTDPTVADTEAFVRPLLQARGVWFPGGRQWRLADAYLGTKVHDELWALWAVEGSLGARQPAPRFRGPTWREVIPRRTLS